MCFGGGGPSAEELYEKQKPEFGALPSLSVSKKKRQDQILEDVPRTSRRSSLLTALESK